MKEQIKEYMINKFGHFPQDLDQLTEFIGGFNASLSPSVTDEEGDEKICTGCGHIESDGLKHGFACCPDNKHLPLREFLKAWHKDNEQKAEFVRKHIKPDELVDGNTTEPLPCIDDKHYEKCPLYKQSLNNKDKTGSDTNHLQ